MNTMNLTPATGMDHTVVLSSTQASVDSDSDYQAVSSYNMEECSRPGSRTSTLSGVSTIATKDGIEGNRIRRTHDPMGFILHPTLTTASQRSEDTESNISDESHSTIDSSLVDALDLGNSNGISNNAATSTYIPGDESVPRSTMSLQPGTRNHKHPQKQKSKILQYPTSRQEGGSDNRSESNKTHLNPAHPHHPHPPNEPDAPPVTLREKINLLRTGLVEGLESESDMSLDQESNGAGSN